MSSNAHWLRRTIHAAAAWIVIAALVVGALGAAPRTLYAQDDVEEANKALVAMLYDEIVNKRNFDIMLEYTAEGFVEHTRDGDITYATPEEYVASLEEDFADTPEQLLTIRYQLADGDQVVTAFTIEIVDLEIAVEGLSVVRVVDGKIAEMDEILDEVVILSALGLIPDFDEEPTEDGAMAEELIADGFNGPMGVLVDDEDNVWVVDSGVGGDIEFTMPDIETGEMTTVTVGDTSRIVKIAPDGTLTDVAVLPSVMLGDEGSGGSRLTILDGVLYATSGGWREGIGDERMPLMASIVSIDADGTVEEIANTWDIESSENPGGFARDTHPYDIEAGPDGLLWIADAGANTVFTVDPTTGEVSLVAVIDAIPIPFPNPERNNAMETDPVPSGVVPTEDGGAYVSLLPGFPFMPGSAKVVYISPEGEVSDYATGLTMITDLQQGPDGELYAVQLGIFTDQGPTPNSGAIWRVQEGEASQIIYTGLSFPTSIDFNAAGDAYITINGVGAPETGALIRIPAMTEMGEILPVEPDGGIGGPMGQPLPEAAVGPALSDEGYLVEELGEGLYWVTDGTYQSIFLTTGEGVIVVDAPPALSAALPAAIAEVTDEPVTHVIYSHAHADHIGAAGIFPADATYIAHAETAAALAELGADDPNREVPFAALVGGGPVSLPTVTFEDTYVLEVGDQVLELAYHGANHVHGNTFIYAPTQKVLMVVDVVYPGWVPYMNLSNPESISGLLAAHDQILEYDFDIFVGGHLTRYGTREDVEAQAEYLADIRANALTALQTTDFMAIAAMTGFENTWLLVGTYLDTVSQTCADLTVEKWGELLGGADVFAKGHCDRMIASLRLE